MAARSAGRSARASPAAAAMCTASSGVSGDAARLDAQVAAPRRHDERHAGPTAAAIPARSAAGSACAVGEDALDERVVAHVHIADHGELVPGGERRLITGGDLHVDRLERREPPGRLVIGEGRHRAGADRGGIGVGRARASRAAPARRRRSPSSGGSCMSVGSTCMRTSMNGPPPPSGSARSTPAAPIAFTPPQYQRPASNRAWSAGAMSGDERRAHRHVEVAHAVEVAERPRAVGHARIAGRVAPGQLDERRVERAKRAAQRRRAMRRPPRRARPRADRAPRGRAPHAASACVSSAARSSRSGCGPAATTSSVEARRKRLHPPCLEVHVAARARAPPTHLQRRPLVLDPAPGEGAEEPDRVVLAAVALPVARDDLLALARPAGLGRRSRGDLSRRRSRAPPGSATSPPPGTADRPRLPQPAGLVARPEHVEARDRETGATDSEVAPQSPVARKPRVPAHQATLAAQPSTLQHLCSRSATETRRTPQPQGRAAPAHPAKQAAHRSQVRLA